MTTVTQADREAAADIVGPKSNEGKYPGFACDYREGRCDTSNLVQAFAAHREAAFEAGAKAMHAAVSAELYKCGEPCPKCHDAIAALDPAQIAGGGK